MLKLNHIIFKAAFLLTLFTEISEIHSTTFDVPEGKVLPKNKPLKINGPLIKDGLGEIDLNTANTFKNGVQIKTGTVLIANNDSLGEQPTVEFVNTGGTLTTAPLSSGVATISLTSIKVDKGATTALLAPSANTTLVTPILIQPETTGTLKVAGAGIVSVSAALPAGALNYSVSGVLRLANATTTAATGEITVESGGTLDLATNSAGDDDIPNGPNPITIKSGGIINLPPGTFSKNITLG